MEIKFSILIPAYKTVFLDEAILSVKNQDYSNWELVIVDDDSPFDVFSIVNKYKDSRIRYFRNDKNCGAINVVDNWNICLGYSTGEYVICMGDDDRLLSCCLSEYSKLIKEYPNLNVYHAWTQIIDEKGNVTKVLEPSPKWESFYSLTYYRWTNRRQFIGDFCYRKDYLSRNNGYYKLPLAWMSDDITAARAALDNGIANTSVPCFEYRISSVTISNSTNMTEVKLNSSITGHQWYKNILLHVDPETLSESDKWYYSSLLSLVDSVCERRMLGEIINEVQSNPVRILKWFFRCTKFRLRRKTYVKRIVLSIFIN